MGHDSVMWAAVGTRVVRDGRTGPSLVAAGLESRLESKPWSLWTLLLMRPWLFLDTHRHALRDIEAHRELETGHAQRSSLLMDSSGHSEAPRSKGAIRYLLSNAYVLHTTDGTT